MCGRPVRLMTSGQDRDRCHRQLMASGNGAGNPLSTTLDTRGNPLTMVRDRKVNPVNAMTGNYPPAAMRASDADRDAVVSDLSEHFQAGRLTAGELDERTGRALAARTRGELQELLADLPVDRSALRTPAAASSSTRLRPPSGR